MAGFIMRYAFLPGAAALILAIAGCTGTAAQPGTTATSQSPGPGPAPGVLLVCNGSTAPCPALPASAAPYYRTIQDAVDSARPGDWILIYPGVYHEGTKEYPTAGVWIQTPDLHIRGMDRNKVIIDGSNGTAAHPCPSAASQQDFTSRDGIVVWKTTGVTIENLTVCDFLAAGNTDHGNEIWWNGGDASGHISGGSYSGSYLTATSEYAPRQLNSPQLAQYGIFVSNSRGPGLLTETYASNMADAAYYIGGCARMCNVTLSHVTGLNSSEGYSGTNAGGKLVIEDSVFRLNRAGVAPNSENNDDEPAPQDGRCPGSATVSCMIIEGNLIEANNNPNAPGNPAIPPTGTGIELVGSLYDTVVNNVIEDQGSWGILVNDNPDNEQPPPDAHCIGGIENYPLHGFCLYKARGNLIFGNVFSHDGYFGNLADADLALDTLAANTPRDCFYRNVDLHGPLTSAPARIQSASVDGQPCGGTGSGNDSALTNQLICATGAFPCHLPARQARYPKQTTTVLLPLPRLASMPNPCAGVPKNIFCP
jgi:hypothetical protein